MRLSFRAERGPVVIPSGERAERTPGGHEVGRGGIAGILKDGPLYRDVLRRPHADLADFTDSGEASTASVGRARVPTLWVEGESATSADSAQSASGLLQ